MGLFSKNKKVENAVQVNDVNKNMPLVCGWDALGWIPHKKGFKPFGEIYLQMALNALYNGISNITFETTKQASYVANGICSFLDNNATLLTNMWLYKGFIAVFYDKDHNYALPTDNQLRFDQYGRVINKNTVVIYSPLYQTKRKNYMQLVMPLVGLIDTLANTMNESGNTMGVLPVISGNSIPASPAFKEKLSEAMTKDYGWGGEQMKYFLSQAELKIDQIDLHIKDLELRDNILSSFKALLNYLEVPVDLVIGNSTYANVESAKVYFYENTIRKYAETFLKIGQALLVESDEFLPKKTITYRLTNVSGLDTTISDKCKERDAYIDTLIKLKNCGVTGVDEEFYKVFEDVKKDYLEV